MKCAFQQFSTQTLVVIIKINFLIKMKTKWTTFYVLIKWKTFPDKKRKSLLFQNQSKYCPFSKYLSFIDTETEFPFGNWIWKRWHRNDSFPTWTLSQNNASCNRNCLFAVFPNKRDQIKRIISKSGLIVFSIILKLIVPKNFENVNVKYIEVFLFLNTAWST